MARHALYEVRNGQILYLKPVESPKMIKGVMLPPDTDLPSEAFLFDRLDAGITRPRPVGSQPQPVPPGPQPVIPWPQPWPCVPDPRLTAGKKLSPWM